MFLAALFKPFSPGATKLMDKLLATTTLEPGDWMKLVEEVGLNQNEWGDFLLDKDHLSNLLVGLGGDGIGRGVWQGYLDALTPALVSPELIEVGEGAEATVVHEWERKVHAHLKTAADRLTAAGVKLAPALPEGGVARLFAANNLLKWVKDPFTAERAGSDEIKHACAAFGIEPYHVVEVAFKQGEYAHHDPAAQPQEFAPLMALFKTCFPVDHSFNTAGRAVREAIKLSKGCQGRSRGAARSASCTRASGTGTTGRLLTADWKGRSTRTRRLAWLSECVNRPQTAKKPSAPARPRPGRIRWRRQESEGSRRRSPWATASCRPRTR